MRICLLSYRGNMFCGGQGVYVYNLSKALADLGHEVHLLAGPPLPRQPVGVHLYRVENLNLFGKKATDMTSYPVSSLFSPLNFMEFAATRLGNLPEMLTFSLRAFMILKRLLSGYRFDVIHDNQCLGYGLLLMKGLGIPLVATIHHPLSIDRKEHLAQAVGFKEKFKRLIYYPPIMQHLVSRRLDRVIAVSQSSADRILNIFSVNGEKMRVVHNGVDTAKFSPSDSPDKQEDKRIIFVGNTDDRKKGFKYLLEAMRIIGDGMRLTVVNGADNKPHAANGLVRLMGLSDRVEFLSGVSDERLVEEYRKSSVAVVPSTYEGFGFPAAEAMSCGVPVIAADAGALPEVVGRDGTAVLVAPKTPEAIAEAVRTVMNDRDQRHRLSREGRRRIEEKFSWNRTARETVKVYQEAIHAHRQL